MRIISKFKDVYDLQGTLYDEEQTWNRVTEDIQVKDNQPLAYYFNAYQPDEKRARRERGYSVGVEPLFLAGQVHFLYTIIGGGELQEEEWGAFNPPMYEDFITFSSDKFLARLKELKVTSLGSMLGLFGSSGKDLDKQFDKVVSHIENNLRAPVRQLLEELRVPLALVTGSTGNAYAKTLVWDISTNFCFNDLRLPWHEIEPNLYIMHQHLAQYIFGVLGTEQAEMVSTSDKDRLVAHGFNTVTSFRNMERD